MSYPIVPKLIMVRLVPSWQQPALVCLPGACRLKEEYQDVYDV